MQSCAQSRLTVSESCFVGCLQRAEAEDYVEIIHELKAQNQEVCAPFICQSAQRPRPPPWSI